MGLSDNVAVVALVVSLIALVIALGQLAQQLLGTAEGYRRCAEPVIGPWSRLRWRHWIWSEFRYETHFVTPLIIIQSVQAEHEDSNCVSLKNAYRDRRQTSSFGLLLRPTRESAIRDAPAILCESVMERRSDEKNADTRVSPAFRPPSRPTALLQTENNASWLPLLREIYVVHQRYAAVKRPSSRPSLSKLLRNDEKAPAVSARGEDNSVGHDVVIKFTEWIWDILPNDVSKPLATTTLGTIVMLSLRVGMQWRTLDGVNSDQLLADGDGYSITFTDYPGLGLVVRFRDSGRRSEPSGPPLLIPGRAADKLACGIVPGAKYFVDRDIPTVFEDRKEQTMVEVCKRISLSNGAVLPKRRNTSYLYDLWISKDEPLQVQNEIVTLLCEFIVVPESRCTMHYFWGWKFGRQSAFKAYEARLALWRHLKQQEDAQNLVGDDFAAICGRLTYLRDVYKNDFFNSKAKMAVNAADDSQGDAFQTQANLIEDCRTIFQWTTNWFLRHDFSAPAQSNDEADTRTLYMHLVGAHAWMACHAIPPVLEKAEANKKKPKLNTDFKHKFYELGHDRYGVPVQYTFFNPKMYLISQAYIESIHHPEYGVIKYMSDLDSGVPDEVVEVAWWVMMLRGIVWTMSTTDDKRGEPIPSTFYENDTPVWIT